MSAPTDDDDLRELAALSRADGEDLLLWHARRDLARLVLREREEFERGTRILVQEHNAELAQARNDYETEHSACLFYRRELDQALRAHEELVRTALSHVAALARVEAYAAQHADWCCSKGCTAPEDPCDQSCNCESGAILAAIAGTEPPPGTGHRAAPHAEADLALAPARALLGNLRAAITGGTP